MTLIEALQALDPDDDDHWTAEGWPAMAAVEGIAGRQFTRREVDAVAPDFTRMHRVLPAASLGEAAEEEAADDREAVAADPVAALAARIAALDAQADAAIRQRDAANAAIARLTAEREPLQRQLDALKPRVDTVQQDINAYLSSQRAARAARAERRRAQQAQQPDDPRAPIDQAFANRRRMRPVPAADR